jgi:hypothetical protein
LHNKVLILERLGRKAEAKKAKEAEKEAIKESKRARHS